MIHKRSMKECADLAAVAVLFLSRLLLSNPFALETNTDRPGMDYSNFDLGGPTRAYVNKPQCGLFGLLPMFKPGFQGPNARCWLKNGIPAANPSECWLLRWTTGIIPSKNGTGLMPGLQGVGRSRTGSSFDRLDRRLELR